jgi:hypothetical protein
MSKLIFTRLTLAFMLFLTLGAFKAQGQATIKTDLLDYPPGSTAIITGTGFQAGETVTLQVVHVGEDPSGTDAQYHQPWTVIAGDNGNVAATWWVPDDGDALGATFNLTAVGLSSGLQAAWEFTDGINKDPSNLTVCDGSAASFTMTTTGNGNAQTWQLSTNNGVTFVDISNGGIYSGVNTTSLSISATNGSMNGYQYRCKNLQSGNTAFTAAAILTINLKPTASAGGNQTICQNGTATVSGASSSNGTILWTENGAGIITSGATTLTPTYTAAAGDAGNTVILTMTVSNSPCAAASATYSVIVKPTPTASAGGSQTICQNGTATVSGASSSNGTILWTHDGAGSISNATTLTPTYTAAAGDAGNTVTLTMTVSNSTCTAATATYSVIVQATPTASAGGSQAICANGTATVSGASSSNGTILWTENGAGSITLGATTLAPTYTAAAGDAGNTVTLTMTVSNSPCTSATATYSVIVKATPAGSITGTQTICSGSSASLNISVTGTGPWSGTLSNGQAFSGNSSPISVSVNPSTNTTYTIATLSDANCTSIASDKTGSAIVTVNPTPTATIVVNGTNPICSGSSSTIKLTGPNNGVVTYNINGGSDLTATLSNGGNVTVSTGTLTSTSTFNLVSVAYGTAPFCSTSVSGSAIVTVNQPPVFTACPTNISVNNDAGLCTAAVTYTSAASGIPASTYS